MHNRKLSGLPDQGHSKAERFSASGFILTAIGSAVGLGNMWKFPYITGKYGGAAFFLLFIICLMIVGIPVLLAELAIGRGGRGNAATSFTRLSGSKAWGVLGFLSIFGAFMILSFYSVIAGWTIHYAVLSFSNVLYADSNYAERFAAFAASNVPLLWQAIVMIISGWVVAKGISGGIEKFNKVLIPGLLVLLLVLMVRSLSLPGAMEGVKFFLKPDFSKLTGESVLVALGHAFFSLSLGMGAMVTYGRYVERRQSLGAAAAAVGAGDLLYAFIAGLIVFPTSFAFGIEPGQGPGLVFIALPAAFSAMPFGNIFGGMFFVLLAVAALTSAVSLLEVAVVFVIDKWGWGRKKATLLTAAACFLTGIPSALSIGGILGRYTIAGKAFFDFIDFVASNILLPVSGLVVTLFTGYVWKKAGEEAGLSTPVYRIWIFVMKYIAPVLVLLIFLYSSGVLGLE